MTATHNTQKVGPEIRVLGPTSPIAVPDMHTALKVLADGVLLASKPGASTPRGAKRRRGQTALNVIR